MTSPVDYWNQAIGIYRKGPRLMRHAIITILIVLLLCSSSGMAQSTGSQHWKSRDLLESTCLILAHHSTDTTWHPFGTGVIIDVDSTFPMVFLVTARHVYMGRDTLLAQFPRYSESGNRLYISQIEIEIIRDQTTTFCPSTPDSDFVAVFVKREPAEKQFSPISRDQMVGFDDLSYGEDVEFYGYPAYDEFRLTKSGINLPICRTGHIAYFAPGRVGETNEGSLSSGTFLVDGVSIGGGSGAPLFLKRPFVIKASTDSSILVYDRRLAGIVRGHFPKTKGMTIPFSQSPMSSKVVDKSHPSVESSLVAISTEDYNFVADENSNLAIVTSIEKIVDYILRSLLEKRSTN